MIIKPDIKLDYSDVLFEPKPSTLTTRQEVSLHRELVFKHSGQTFNGVPIMASNMDGVGTFDMAETLANEHQMFTALVKSYTPDQIHDWFNNRQNKDQLANHFSISTGITEADQERVDSVMKFSRAIKYVTIDVANGYTERFLDFVKQFREKWPSVTIIAGNVVTPEITQELILSGADVVKVGIGPGSVCTTRIKTGVGYPQLSAVIECADAAHSVGGHIVADGGCSSPGDVAKAFGAGADFVMLGGMLAGTTQGGGKTISKMYTLPYTYKSGHPIVEWQKEVQFYGMSSTKAQEKHSGPRDYRASEGRVVSVPYRGDVQPVVRDILGGVRSTCTYVGARSLAELHERTTFIRVNNGRQYNTTFEAHTTGE